MDSKDNVKVTGSLTVDSVNYNVMFSSGSNSDCMIHSILTASSPSFRRIREQDDRYPIATLFRKNVFYSDSIKSAAAVDSKQEMDRKQKNWKSKFLCYTPGLYLEAFQLGTFSDTYNFCVLMNELDITYNIIADNASKQIGIFLANKGGGHFESVRRSTEGKTDPYIFTRDELLAIQATKVDPRHKNTHSNPCEYKAFDLIENSKKERFVVVEAIFPNSQVKVDCSGIRTIPFLKSDGTKVKLTDIAAIRDLDKFKTRAEYIAKTIEIKRPEFVNYTVISSEVKDGDFDARASVVPEVKTKGGNYRKTKKNKAKKSKKGTRRR